ncbi:hypothetical protein EST38_g6592 [Candolleomyces aberdarensis]|uniref:Transcription activator of gluconeogenesis ERT1 n=1 Tax=Candolleomyces aberdarensis TaxID=2316362 RepID=A0A4Q2DH86_9AGAR|nr:hypothetical protein EST38_g6592 [Candolleomyces aberdarensis]
MTEQTKTPAPAQDHPYPQPVLPYPQAYNGAYPPPPPGTAPYPPYFYPPPTEGSHSENGQNAMPPGPYMMLAPPGVVYVHQPPPQGQPFPAPGSASASQTIVAKPKRKQVKMACTNCAAACKRCDEQRPCERCQKYGIADSCVDGQRKERKKGIKRGPYKRKNKSGGEAGEWSAGAQPPPPSASTAAAAIHAVTAQLSPEGYYPTLFYPPPYLTHPPDGQPGPDGAPPHVSGQPMMQYYIHPGGYPPYGHYPAIYPPPHPPPPPGAPPPTGAPAPAPEQPQTVNPADTSKKDDVGDANGTEPVTNGKKRSRSSKNGEPKGKRNKPSTSSRADKDKEAERAGDGPDGDAGDSL